MRKHLSGIDHVVVLVRDLDRARDAYARMGFTLTPRGYHTLGSQNHCIMFARDYIELLAVPKPHPAMQYFSDFLARGDGLGAIALASGNAAAARAELKGSGIGAEAPLDFSRPVEGGEAKFRIVQLPSEATPGCRTFICQHFTRELVWRPQFQSHALGATALAGLAVSTEEPGAVTTRYAGVFAEEPRRVEEGLVVDTGSAPIAVAAPGGLRRRLDGASLPARPSPLVAALFVRVADRTAAAAALRRGGYAPVQLKDGSYALDANDAHGVALVFG
jgi:catechol 2,3-dioxygenase-like lactoylglutathione lyase family enzyme